jgi:phosphoglycolate phosphatase
MKKIIIFDLDGTLLNTLDDLADSTNIVMKAFGYPQHSKEDIRNFVGNGVAKLIERAIPNGKENKNYNKCLDMFKEIYPKNMYNKTAPYQGITDMLKNLKEKGLIIAVVSNKFDLAVKELCEKYFPNLIDFCAGENEKEGIRKKPAPDTVLKVLEQYNLKNNDAIYVGDSEVDIQTAQNSNMPCISVCWGFKDREFLTNNGAEIIINTPTEITDILDD